MLAKERGEKLDESLDKLGKLMERWDQRLTLDNLALAERYLKGELRIVVHARHGASGRRAEEYCAIFKRILPVGWTESKEHGNVRRHGPFGAVVEGAGEVQDDTLVCASDGNKEYVLICDVETVEPPKRLVPSLVRLGLLNNAQRTLGNSLYFSKMTGFKSVGALENGEPGLVNYRAAADAHKFAGQQVERGPKIVDSIAYDGAPPERGLGRNSDLKDALASLRLIVGDDFIGFALPKNWDERFEVMDVLFGPFDLYPSTTEIGLAGHG